ncbi:MAG TPA: thiamine-phosphate kinase [Dehalococcoidales bacterium]|nr:thiamine-phosphate kinase [Dehalococcoidales bacterium]
MKVSELGEFGLIDLLAKMVHRTQDKQVEAWKQLIIGIGDDAAVWHGDASTQLATTDLLIQGVHFPSDITSWKGLGWRAMAANLSDIAAMGGVPRYALISLALPGDTEVEDVTDFYQGMIELAQQFDVAIVGGDTSGAPLVTISITVLGSTKGQDKHILTRSAAKTGDKVAVTGYLGAAAAGVRMLKQQLQFDPKATACFKQAFLRPYPRIAEGQLLVERGVKTAIDISDGLISDLKHICQASQVGARIEVERVPIQSEVTANFGDSALELALAGGEDYELLFTADSKTIDKIKTAISCPVTIIGEIVAGKIGEITLIDREGKLFNLPKGGWEHFTAR